MDDLQMWLHGQPWERLCVMGWGLVMTVVAVCKLSCWACKGAWHAGAWLTTPGPLSDEARLVVTKVLCANRSKDHQLLQYGDTIVGSHKIEVGTRDVRKLFNYRDRAAIRKAVSHRLAFLDSVERDTLRQATAEGKAQS